ncbi:F-box protein At2g32560-like [Mercurialis annua]|uniref:F-box protein At2g32560-like n=1 Tax=Mercurialis annua TaxID=3986 RepID=UPI00215EA407|nr:F-box protein At2g32560-like [Mercurialis annua]
MLLYLLITCFSFFFLKSLPLKPLPSWASEVRLLSLWFCKDLIFFPYFGYSINTLFNSCFCSIMSLKKMALISHQTPKNTQNQATRFDEEDEMTVMSVLDLPELALECILEKLPPQGLCSMAGVCSSLREKCMSDYLWEKHMKQKWGKIIGSAAYREWQFHLVSRNDFDCFKQGRQKGFMKLLSIVWPISWIKSKEDCNNNLMIKQRCSNLPAVDSIMSWYLALENGSFWFPAQVYNRENGHVGFMLSCYDADLSYDPRTDTFQARYPPHGRRAIAIENGVTWERLRSPPIDTSPHDLHISTCLNDLLPGDHIEIQWRRNKEFPYGWWYGVVGHLDSCDGNENYCRCHSSDTVVLEFHQYTRGSRWRCTMINRKEHREEGNEADGFYGGIRKLNSNQEISRWKQLWPTQVLE